ncbi:PBAN-type neuropeptides-like [Atheta coriaria]|uniref:PBAN-type neuropeptides-like n=1 Tax=Dalotia coriaria TaxID=877792 RepID=UPI0031F40735
MERFVVVLSALLLILITQSVFASEAHEDASLDFAPKKKYGQLWFGPRLGRRKRTPEGYKTSGIERQQLEALIDLIHDSPWAIVAVNGNENKRYDVNFVPRLGRESGEDVLVSGLPNMGGERLLQDPEFVGEVMSQRSPPFAPRLGKRVLPFSPRLGRENFQPDRS